MCFNDVRTVILSFFKHTGVPNLSGLLASTARRTRFLLLFARVVRDWCWCCCIDFWFVAGVAHFKVLCSRGVWELKRANRVGFKVMSRISSEINSLHTSLRIRTFNVERAIEQGPIIIGETRI